MKGLPYEVKALVAKARESALLAVETYNRPMAHFRSGAYVVLMNIAWTSLFHAIFLRKRTKPFYRKSGSRRFQKLDGDPKRWELTECLQQHFKEHNPPIRKNLEFFIKIRHKIEHCTLAELDPEIFGECQAMLINFESMLCEQFGDRYAINGGLSFALQFSRTSGSGRATGSGKLQAEAKSFKRIKQYIDTFRSSLSTDVQSDLAYSFKVFLVPKIGNHASRDAVAVEFVKYDPSKPDEMQKYEHIVSLIKPKEISVSNLDKLKPGDVVRRVGAKLGKPFNMHHHIMCYRHFNARPHRRAPDPKACDSRYCVYDVAHKDYVYTEAWVAHLLKVMSDPTTYSFLLSKKQKALAASQTAEGVAA